MRGLRHPFDFLDPVSHPRNHHVVSFSKPFGPVTLVYSIVDYNKSLGEAYESVLVPWRNHRELSEGFRCLSLAHFRAAEALAAFGWIFVVFCVDMMSYDPQSNLVKLSFMGAGYLGKIKKPPCNSDSGMHSAVLMRRNTSFYLTDEAVAEGAVPPATVNRNRLKELSRERKKHAAAKAESAAQNSSDDELDPTLMAGRHLDDGDMRKLWTNARTGKPVALNGRLNWDPKGLCVDEKFIKMYEDETGKPDMELLRLADAHQIMVWYVCQLRGEVDTKRLALANLKRVIGKPDARSRAEAMSVFLHGGEVDAQPRARRQTIPGPDMVIQQPAAMRRICTMAIMALDPETRKEAAEQLTDVQWLRNAAWSAKQEAELRKEGIPLLLRKYPFSGEEFQQVVDRTLQGEPGFKAFGAGREVLLKDEEGMGPGVFGPGTWNVGDFVGFYLAVADAHPSGRHLVTTMGDTTKWGDGAPGWLLPLALFFERGTPGSFINAASSQGAANLRLDRDKAIRHSFGGREYILYPLFVRTTFSNAFFRWFYNHSAGQGCYFPDY